MKKEEMVRDRLDQVMQMLKKTDVTDKQNDHKILAISAALRELQWVLDD